MLITLHAHPVTMEAKLMTKQMPGTCTSQLVIGYLPGVLVFQWTLHVGYSCKAPRYARPHISIP